jgi:hypothetical protein
LQSALNIARLAMTARPPHPGSTSAAIGETPLCTNQDAQMKAHISEK